jgi:D-sedoheptulose 7-phosphate isomerase
MDDELIEITKVGIEETRDALAIMAEDRVLHALVVDAARACFESLSGGGKLLLVGNGGSAADAQHIAAEFVNYFNFERHGLAAVALTTDTSVLTSISNDSHFERVFARQIQAIGRPGDVLIAYSTSGRSKNVIAAIRQAKENGLRVIGLTGKDQNDMSTLCDFILQTPSSSTPKIQEGHLALGHILSGLVERMFFGIK